MKNIFVSKSEKVPVKKAVFNMVLLTTVMVVFFWAALASIGVSFNFSFLAQYRNVLLQGFAMTLALSAVSMVLSLVIGSAGAAMQLSNVLPLRYLAKFYVTVIRGTPLIVQIYLFFYIISTALGIGSRFISGVIILSVFEGAYISEIIRGGYLSLSPTQLEAAKAVGFTGSQTMRFVVLPQMSARVLPALAGQFSSVIKDSSLLSMIALIELTQTIREITAINFNIFEGYFLLGVLYLALTLPVSFVSKKLEKRFAYDN